MLECIEAQYVIKVLLTNNTNPWNLRKRQYSVVMFAQCFICAWGLKS